MLTAERRQYILEALRRDGKVHASALAEALAVSEDTIRRDLRELADAGLIQRVHGGALPTSGPYLSYSARQEQDVAGKDAIGRAAAQLLRTGQIVILDGGTTTLRVAQHLPADLRATVVTNSPPIAVVLAEHPGVEVVLVGGRLYKDQQVAVGAAAVQTLQMIRADICLLGVCSVHPEVGISVDDLEEAYVKRAMMAASAEVVALATPEKLGTAAPFVVGPIGELTRLITESGTPEHLLAPYRGKGIHVVPA